MNHYPGPRRVDRMLAEKADLSSVPLVEPTWKIRGSKHEWAARVGAAATRRPLDSFDARLDALLYRGLELVNTSIVTVESDHRAIIGSFSFVDRLSRDRDDGHQTEAD